MVNYAKRIKEIISEGGVIYFVSYSVKILRKIRIEKKKEKKKRWYTEKMLKKVREWGGLLGENNFTYWWSKEKFDKITAMECRDFWGDTKDFQYKTVFPDRYDNMFSFIKNNFWQHLDKKDHVAEIACAAGETVFGTSEYVEWVDGYEYSQFMVDRARETAAQLGITNVSFMQFDVIKQKITKCYDALTVLGLFTYILDEGVVEKALKNMLDSLKPGGYLILKDSYHDDPDKTGPVYCYNFGTGYQAIYRSKEAFFNIMKKNGFVLEEEAYLAHKDEKDPFDYCSVISTWRKCS